MTQINTEYKNLGPAAQAVSTLKDNAFFQEPEGDSVYRVLFQNGATVYTLCLDDLTHVTFKMDSVVIPVEVNSIEVKVELLP